MNPFGKIMHSNSLHLTIPFQLLQGIIYFLSALLLILKKMEKDLIPFIPENVLSYICIIGSLVGGFYLIANRFHRAKILL